MAEKDDGEGVFYVIAASARDERRMAKCVIESAILRR